ncbi:MAG: hypothetical protein U0640_00895 [Phycisphaerales bacterium]
MSRWVEKLGKSWVRIYVALIVVFVTAGIIGALKWWTFLPLCIAAIVWWSTRRVPNVRVNVPAPKPRWSCDKCGYSLDEIPEQEGIAEGVRVVRPTCPECGHRQLE